MDDYTLTATGRAFVLRVLVVCVAMNLSWSQLWTAKTSKARTARKMLDLGKSSASLTETSRILGATVVTDLVSTFVRTTQFEYVVGLLAKTDLLSTTNVTIAAQSFGITDQKLWDLISPEEAV